MWFLFFFIVIPFILFIGFLVFSIFAIFLINRIFHKKYSQSFSLILPCFSLIFYFILIMGGISFKSIDPQYYEFKELCKGAGQINFNQQLYEDYKNPKYKEVKPDDIYVNSRIIEFSRRKTYFDNKIIALHKGFIYINYGIFLRGDEAAGFYFRFKEEIGCKENNKFTILKGNK